MTNKTTTALKSLKKSLADIDGGGMNMAIQHIVSWLHDHSHAVAIFTPEEISKSSLTNEDIEESMRIAAFMTIDIFKVAKDEDINEAY
jgi:hypothetical protein